jgi:hypothetical protein
MGRKGFATITCALIVDLAIAIGGHATTHRIRRTSVASPPIPAVISSTYLGGAGFEIAWRCAVDHDGSVYIGGDAQAADFPVTSNAVQKTYGDGGQDGFVTKYDRNGKLLWSTFLGGTSWDGVFGLTTDAAGNVVVTGVTESTDFPVTANAVQSTLPGGDAAFVTVISADGTQVLYSTFLGGTQSDGGVPLPTNPFHILPDANVVTLGTTVAVGSDGTLYVTGTTNAIDLPITSGAAQSISGGETDGFIAHIKIDNAGSAGLLYLTYLGGATSDLCSAIAVDQSGNAFIAGQTQSPNFPVTPGAYQLAHTVGTAAFVTKLNASGTSFVYSTLLSGTSGGSAGSGTNASYATALAIDSLGRAVICGATNDTDFPTTPGALQTTNAGIEDGFVAKFSADGSALVFSTYLGGSDYDGLFALKIDNSGDIAVGGFTASRNAPLASAFQPTFGGYYDSWIAKISGDGTNLLLSSFLGGNDQDSIYGLDLWNNELYVIGRTASGNFPTTNSAPQKNYAGGIWDVFLTQLNLNPSLDLKITSLVRLTNGNFSISGTAGPLRAVSIEASADLIGPFARIGSTTSDFAGAFQFEDADAATLSQRFYRAVYP